MTLQIRVVCRMQQINIEPRAGCRAVILSVVKNYARVGAPLVSFIHSSYVGCTILFLLSRNDERQRRVVWLGSWIHLPAVESSKMRAMMEVPLNSSQ